MKKKELLKMIEELRTQVYGLQSEVAILKAQMWGKQDREIYIPTVFGTVDPNVCTDGGQHDYPSPWGATVPPSCKKCGKMAESWSTISCTATTADVVGCRHCREDRIKTGLSTLPDDIVRELERKL